MSGLPGRRTEIAIWPRLLMLGREPGTNDRGGSAAVMCTGATAKSPFSTRLTPPLWLIL